MGLDDIIQIVGTFGPKCFRVKKDLNSNAEFEEKKAQEGYYGSIKIIK